jgi:hypothetical protein
MIGSVLVIPLCDKRKRKKKRNSGITDMDKGCSHHNTSTKLFNDGEDMGVERFGKDSGVENRAKDSNGAGDEDDEQAADAQGDVVISVLSSAGRGGASMFGLASASADAVSNF